MCDFELWDVSLRCFVATQLLLRIYALSSVKLSGLNLWLCKKCDKYEVWTKGVSMVVMTTGNKERRCCCQVVQTRCNWMAKASGNKDVAPFSFFVNKAKNCDVKQITTFHPVYENRSDDVSSPNLDQECLKIGSLNPSKPL